jgi:hypothetical protein
LQALPNACFLDLQSIRDFILRNLPGARRQWVDAEEETTPQHSPACLKIKLRITAKKGSNVF